MKAAKSLMALAMVCTYMPEATYVWASEPAESAGGVATVSDSTDSNAQGVVSGKVETIYEEIEVVNEEIAQYEPVYGDTTYAEAEQQYNEALEAYNAVTEQIANQEKAVEDAQNELDAALEVLDSAQKAYDDAVVTGVIEDIDQTELDALRQEYADAEAALAECDALLNASQEHLATLQEELVTQQGLYTELEQTLSAKEAEYNTYSAEATELQGILTTTDEEATIADLTAQLTDLNNLLAGYEVELANLQNAVAVQQGVVENAQGAVETAQAEYDAALADEQVWIDEVVRLQGELDVLEGEYAVLEQARADAEADLAAKKDAEASALVALNNAKKAVERAQANLTAAQNGSATVDLTAYQKAVDDAYAKYNQGSQGYYKYLSTAGSTEAIRKDAQKAYNIMTKTDGSLEDGAKKSTNIYDRTHTGDAADCTNLDNMKQVFDKLEECNDIRANGESSPIAALKVNSSCMAIAQLQANWSSGVVAHSQAFNVGENLAWGYDDPYTGWYTKEKKLYDSGVRDFGKVGHYLNIINSSYTVTGYGYAAGSDILYGNVDGQVFTSNSKYTGGAVTVAQYKTSFMKYYKSVKKEISDAEAALEQAKANNKANAIAQAQAALASAQQNLASKQSAYNNASNAVTKQANVVTNAKAAEKAKKEEITAKKTEIADTENTREEFGEVTQEKLDLLNEAKSNLELAESDLNDVSDEEYQLRGLIIDTTSRKKMVTLYLKSFTDPEVKASLEVILDAYLEDLAELEAEIAEITANKDALGTKIEETEKETDVTMKHIAGLEATRVSLEENVQRALEAIEEYETQPTLVQYREALQKAKDNKELAEETVTKYQARLDELTEELALAQAALDDAEDMLDGVTRLQELQEQLDALYAELDELLGCGDMVVVEAMEKEDQSRPVPPKERKEIRLDTGVQGIAIIAPAAAVTFGAIAGMLGKNRRKSRK